MNIRESMEKRELELLSPYASFSVRSRGREREEEECDVRTVFQRDRDRILHSKAFRRLKDKTQVFLAPQGDHYRNRLTHTLEVSQIARTIAKALRLNEDLVEAIALGHDLGPVSYTHLDIQQKVRELEEFSKDYDELFFQIALNYGGRDEIVRGIRKLAQDAVDGKAVSYTHLAGTQQ